MYVPKLFYDRYYRTYINIFIEKYQGKKALKTKNKKTLLQNQTLKKIDFCFLI